MEQSAVNTAEKELYPQIAQITQIFLWKSRENCRAENTAESQRNAENTEKSL